MSEALLTKEAAELAGSLTKISAPRPPGSPRYPFVPVRVILPQGVLADPLESMLVMSAIQSSYRKPVTFQAWLQALENEESPAGIVARVAADREDWDVESLRKSVDIPAELFDDVVSDFKERK
jgi:hypothetical protein